MNVIYWALAIIFGITGLYVGAYVASGAFFDRKMEYNRKLLRQLEERHYDEKEE